MNYFERLAKICGGDRANFMRMRRMKRSTREGQENETIPRKALKTVANWELYRLNFLQ